MKLRSFYDTDPNDREVLWFGWSRRSREGFHAEFGEGQRVRVINPSPDGDARLTVITSDLAVSYTFGTGAIQSNRLNLRISTNFNASSSLPPSPMKLGFDFGNDSAIDLALGPPHLMSTEMSGPFARMFSSWKDSHREMGCLCVTVMMRKEYPWPETGIVCGLATAASLIYHDLVLVRYGISLTDTYSAF